MAIELVRLGIDPAASTGWAVVRGRDVLGSGTWDIGEPGWTKSPEASSKAASLLGVRVSTAVATYCPDEVVCENPTSRSNGISKAYGSLLSAVSAACTPNTHARFVLPTKWKKQVLGKGNASKEDLWSLALELLGREPKSQDEADAVCIAMCEE